jgi:hypothetical protein
MSDSESRRRRISLGELIALGALLVSAIGVWIAWESSNKPAGDKPTPVVEQRQAIPLALRGTADADGRELTITPVEQGHALESLTVTIGDTSRIEVGSDGKLAASDVEPALKAREAEPKGAHSVPIQVKAKYVEAGTDRTGGGAYVLRYRWDSGGLFGGRTLHLVGLSRG